MPCLSKTARPQISAVSLPAISEQTGSPYLQRCLTSPCPNPPVLRSRLYRSQSQTAARPTHRRCPPDTGRQRRLFFVLLSHIGLFQCHGMDHTAFQQLQPQFVKRSSVESLRTAGCRSFKIHSQVLKGRLRGQRAGTPAGHADGVPLFQIPLLFVGKLLKCYRDRLCLYSVPENVGIVPAIVARHILAGFFAVLILFRAVEGEQCCGCAGQWSAAHPQIRFRPCIVRTARSMLMGLERWAFMPAARHF